MVAEEMTPKKPLSADTEASQLRFRPLMQWPLPSKVPVKGWVLLPIGVQSVSVEASMSESRTTDPSTI